MKVCVARLCGFFAVVWNTSLEMFSRVGEIPSFQIYRHYTTEKHTGTCLVKKTSKSKFVKSYCNSYEKKWNIIQIYSQTVKYPVAKKPWWKKLFTVYFKVAV